MLMYRTSDFRGQVRNPVRIVDASGDELFQNLKRALPEALKAYGVPAKVSEDVVKSGGMFGTKSPMLLVMHPNPPSSYFAMGFVVNNNLLSFVYLGESAQNTKMNMKKSLESEGKYLRAAMVKPDEFLLQQENMWNNDVMEAFDAIWEKVK